MEGPGLGELQARINLIGVETEEEAVAKVAGRAASIPKGEWIVGRGWDEGAWANRYPTGRWADLAVLDVDPLKLGETDPGALLDGRIVATIVAGEVVHRADER